jgi:hypothetical protein
MPIPERLLQQLKPQELDLLNSLNSPHRIQAFLDSVRYPAGERNRSILNVIRDRQAHCLDGGLFAAAALNWLGYPALMVDLLPEPGTDDDHILALYQVDGCWGAVAKSNFVGLRLREPVYRSLRELVMSYFDGFFNVEGMMTLRGYTRPIRLERWHVPDWLLLDEGVDVIEKKLKKLPTIPLLSKKAAENLSPVDEISYKHGLGVANFDGLYKPKA